MATQVRIRVKVEGERDPMYHTTSHSEIQEFIVESELEQAEGEMNNVYFIQVGHKLKYDGVTYEVTKIALKLYDYESMNDRKYSAKENQSEVHANVFVKRV